MAPLAQAMRGMSPEQAQKSTGMALQTMMGERQMQHERSMLDVQHQHQIDMAETARTHQELVDTAKADLEERKLILETRKANAEMDLKQAQTQTARHELSTEIDAAEITKRSMDYLREQGNIINKLGQPMPLEAGVHIADQYGVNLIPDDIGIDMGIHKGPDNQLMWIHRRPGETEPTTYQLAQGVSPDAANDIRRLALDYLGADSFSGLDRNSQFQFLNIVSSGTAIASREDIGAVEAFNKAAVATERFTRVFNETKSRIEAAKPRFKKVPQPPVAAEILAKPPYEGEQSVLDFFFEYDLEPTVLEDAIVGMGYSRQEASDIISLAVSLYQRR